MTDGEDLPPAVLSLLTLPLLLSPGGDGGKGKGAKKKGSSFQTVSALHRVSAPWRGQAVVQREDYLTPWLYCSCPLAHWF